MWRGRGEADAGGVTRYEGNGEGEVREGDSSTGWVEEEKSVKDAHLSGFQGKCSEY